jgi:hypothetical protein
MKRGKAGKEAQSYFIRKSDAHERDLIKGMPETEVVQTILAKVKLMMQDGGNTSGLKKKGRK